ncbi:EF-hand domain-containing protein [Sphingomonas sp. BN140010]|uniref:EF-hand domain-containing protein n=1 Tax=Sphingomonas arvum TaxID=2992113 RepID=A0ABT3JFF5_9SPHN|nr:EF-hand domain-containing protein [Sphingomonas sp. BN140010]MCW3797812.1 EF-hand domain-containing protein [Sphingomonas sp. BN140010]
MRAVIVIGLVAILATPAAAQQGGAPKPVTRAEYDANMNREFGEIDANKDGTVSAAELASARQRATAAALQRQSQAMFSKLDINKNGSLSQAEFAKMLDVDPAKLPPAPLLQFDANKDGSVTKAEFAAGTGANFMGLDTNKDGTVTPAELQAAERRESGPQGR